MPDNPFHHFNRLSPEIGEVHKRIVDIVLILFALTFGFMYSKPFECLAEVGFATVIGKLIYLTGIVVFFGFQAFMAGKILCIYVLVDLRLSRDYFRFLHFYRIQLLQILAANIYTFMLPYIYLISKRPISGSGCNTVDWSYLFLDLLFLLVASIVGLFIKKTGV